jgi:hypothetical protein
VVGKILILTQKSATSHLQPEASCGLVLSAFEPKPLSTVPNPENHLLAARATNSDIIFAVPSFIEVRCAANRDMPF